MVDSGQARFSIKGDEVSEETKETTLDPKVAAQLEAAEKRIEQAQAFAIKTHKSGLEKRLGDLERSGRCTPDEAKKQRESLGAIKLSLGDDGEVNENRVESFIEDREGLPAGCLWSDEAKLQRLSVVGHPDDISFGAKKPVTEEEADEIAKRVAGA